jgi:CRISPR/Cas system Type II protein with McrA/HNH and RuvC-like nuclease domain
MTNNEKLLLTIKQNMLLTATRIEKLRADATARSERDPRWLIWLKFTPEMVNEARQIALRCEEILSGQMLLTSDEYKRLHTRVNVLASKGGALKDELGLKGRLA